MPKRESKRKRSRDCPVLHASPRLYGPIEAQLRALAKGTTHGNRTLFFWHVVVAHLLAFFNASVEGLRRIEDIFESESVRRNLGLPRVPKSTLSDAQRVFDPELLRPIVDALRRQVQCTSIQDPKLDALVKDLIAVDGTFFTVAARVPCALYTKARDPEAAPRRGSFRVDVHYDVLRGVPQQAIVSDGRLAEQDSLAAHLEAGKLYVIDRAYQAFQLYADIVNVHSDFVVRLRSGMVFETRATRPLSEADRAAGVQRDEEVSIPSSRGKPLRGVPLRKVDLEYTDRDGQLHRASLLTNRLDLPADVIALLYRYRWQVELFFRWLKCLANLRHFFSESLNGITIQIYVALIATLLLALEMDASPSVYDYALAGHMLSGLIPPDEARQIAARRRAERQRAKERRAAKQAR
jgi:hypothetical protein